jgi:hypothetical protein
MPIPYDERDEILWFLSSQHPLSEELRERMALAKEAVGQEEMWATGRRQLAGWKVSGALDVSLLEQARAAMIAACLARAANRREKLQQARVRRASDLAKRTIGRARETADYEYNHRIPRHDAFYPKRVEVCSTLAGGEYHLLIEPQPPHLSDEWME